ncbi:hypothetical protein VPH35_139280 [Triticum aestivum]
MRGIALALGAPSYALEGGTAGDPFCYLRLIGYPAPASIPQEQRTDTGCGAHTDYGLLTLVNQDDGICALDVRNLSGEWIQAKPVPGTFVCNIGDMLEPTLHRVSNNSPRYRVSVAFFNEVCAHPERQKNIFQTSMPWLSLRSYAGRKWAALPSTTRWCTGSVWSRKF